MDYACILACDIENVCSQHDENLFRLRLRLGEGWELRSTYTRQQRSKALKSSAGLGSGLGLGWRGWRSASYSHTA